MTFNVTHNRLSIKQIIIGLFSILTITSTTCSCNKLQHYSLFFSLFNKYLEIPYDLESFDGTNWAPSAIINKPTLVLYCSLEDCAGCFIDNLVRYQEILEMGVNILPVINTYDENLVTVKLLSEDCISSHCIRIDTNHNFTLKNKKKIQALEYFNACLIDSDYKVVYVGDPIKNQKLYQTFINTINSL